MSHINKCGDWSATLFFDPDGPDKLEVNGQCTFPTPGYKVHLQRKEPQGINPKILLLEKNVTPPTGIEPQQVVTVPVCYVEHTTVRYDEVDILPDGARIQVKQARTAEMNLRSSGG